MKGIKRAKKKSEVSAKFSCQDAPVAMPEARADLNSAEDQGWTRCLS